MSIGGLTELTASDSGPSPPAGFSFVPAASPVYNDIHTDAVYELSIRVRFLYNPAEMSGPEENLRVLHQIGTKQGGVVWEDATLSQSPGNNEIWGEVNALSNFVLAEISCACDCHADPFCDGQTDVFDIVHAVNVGFRNEPDILDPNPLCPYNSTDVDCDGDTDVFDVVKSVNVAFRNELAENNFCAPCAP